MRGIYLTAGLVMAMAAPAAAAGASFVPTSAWLVGPASLAFEAEAPGTKTPCVMANQYDNGFVFRFSGGRGQIPAMAVDFRQPAFTPGNKYKIRIEVPPYFSSDLQAMAYNDATLLINTSATEGFQAALKQSPEMTLTIGGKTLAFSLAGAEDGLRRVEACYNDGNSRAPAVPAVQPIAAPPPAAAPAEPEAEDALTPMPGEALPPTAPSVESLLDAAAAEVKDIEPAAAPPVVAIPEKEIPAVRGQERMMAGTWSSPFASSAQQMAATQPHDIMVNRPASAAPQPIAGAAMPERNWRAMRGNNLQEILGVWARNENVELLWMAGENFSVPQSISVYGTFESAVGNLLEQYGGERDRPVGRIYSDPAQGGKKVLLIELDTQG